MPEQALDGREILTGNIALCRERFPPLVRMELQSSVDQPAFKNVREALRGQLCPITLINYAETLRHVLAKLEQIQEAAWNNPKLVYELAIFAQRDVALTVAALADIQRWMVEVALGKPAEPEEIR